MLLKHYNFKYQLLIQIDNTDEFKICFGVCFSIKHISENQQTVRKIKTNSIYHYNYSEY